MFVAMVLTFDSAAIQHLPNILSSLQRFDFVIRACLKDNRPLCVLVGCLWHFGSTTTKGWWSNFVALCRYSSVYLGISPTHWSSFVILRSACSNRFFLPAVCKHVLNRDYHENYIRYYHYSFKRISVQRSAYFWDFTQRRLVVCFRCFGTNCRSNFEIIHFVHSA